MKQSEKTHAEALYVKPGLTLVPMCCEEQVLQASPYNEDGNEKPYPDEDEDW